MIKLNICIDIDGTITSPYHFIPYLNELYNKNITEEECNTHNWEVLYGVDMNTMISEFHEKYMHSYGEAKVVDDAKNIIDELKKNHTVIVITHKEEIENIADEVITINDGKVKIKTPRVSDIMVKNY